MALGEGLRGVAHCISSSVSTRDKIPSAVYEKKNFQQKAASRGDGQGLSSHDIVHAGVGTKNISPKFITVSVGIRY
jgi:hypothetical protein